MTITHATCSQSDQALMRAFRSIRGADAEIIARVADRFGGAWAVQTCDDYDGYLFVLIEPAGDSAKQSPSYMVSGQTGQLELAMVDHDDCRTLGRFSNIDEVASALDSRLCSTTERGFLSIA